LSRMLPDQRKAVQFHAECPPWKASGKLVRALDGSICKSAS
jgi:hypothetical protein